MDVYAIRLQNVVMLQGSMTRKQLSEKLGIDYGQVGHWFMRPGTKGHRNIGAGTAREIETAFEKETGWLDRQHRPRAGAWRVSEPEIGGFLPDIPIIGFAIGSPDEDGYFDDMGFPPGGGEGYIPWPTMDPNAYALRVKGDSMSPRIRPGELMVIEPASAVSSGDDVLVRMKNGRKMVKRLFSQRRGDVSLVSINQAHKELTISIEEIESMHYVAAILPRGTATVESEHLEAPREDQE